MKYNLSLMEKMKFNDFSPKKQYKRAVEKQPDFYGHNRKNLKYTNLELHSCLFYGDSIADKTKISATESLINSNLKLISDSFSTENDKIGFVDCVSASKLEEIEINCFEVSILFIPIRVENKWKLKIISNKETKVLNNFNDAHEHEEGYGILILATNYLTKSDAPVNSIIVQRFRKFLIEVFKENYFTNCYRCFKAGKLETCNECPLTYCMECAKIGCKRH